MEEKTFIRWITPVTIAIIVALVLFQVCVQIEKKEESQKQKIPTIVSPQLKEDIKVTPKNYDSEIAKRAFMGGCAETVDMYPYCDCVYEYWVQKYGLEAISAIGENPESKEAQKMLIDAIGYCYEKL